MPITPTYSWSETPAWVTVEVLLQSVSQSALDIITTDCFIKVNCLPYLFQADLHDDIDSQKSSAMVEKSVVKLFLLKKTQATWGRLTRAGDRNAILERRQQSLDAIREAAAKTKEEAKGNVARIRRQAVSSQMKLDEVRRKTIESRKEAELREQRDSLKSWQQGLERESVQHISDNAEITSRSDLLLQWDKVDTKNEQADNDKLPVKAEQRVAQAEQTGNQKQTVAVQRLSKIQPKCIVPAKLATLKPGERVLPAPRKSFRVFISFTAKKLPNHLPARESREKELELKKHSPISEDVIDVSEREPLFLQDKGDKFYSSGDYKSAINAYTKAIQKDTSMILCYANRAACYLQTNQMQACIDDCTMAIKILNNQSTEKEEEEKTNVVSRADKSINASGTLDKDFVPVEALDLLRGESTTSINPDKALDWNKKVRSSILSRRGCANGHLGYLADAVADFKEALNLDSSKTDLRRVLDSTATKLEAS